MTAGTPHRDAPKARPRGAVSELLPTETGDATHTERTRLQEPDEATDSTRRGRRARGVATKRGWSPTGVLLVTLALGLTTVSAGWAVELSEVERDRQAESISRSIMSPFCPGRTISACPSPRAAEWRDDIRKWIAEGVDPIEIRSRLAARFPQHNLQGAPRNRLGWALPVGLGVISVAVLWALLRHLTRSGKRGGPEEQTIRGSGDGAKKAAATPQDWDKRLDEELEALEQ